jgi:hypothetical protein
MRRGRPGRGGAVIAAIACALALPATAAAQLGGSEATVAEVPVETTSRSYPVIQYEGGGERAGNARWKTVLGTGNCCEHYVTATAGGMLVDFGGDYPTFTTDNGRTWRSARPLGTFLGGEGAIVPAPGGDVLGVGWDPYTGDRLIAFKFEAKTGKWLYREMPIHQPFYDREWIAVVPGPWNINGQEVPYISFVRGGWPDKSTWLMSTDGLTYVQASNTFVDQSLSETQVGDLAVGNGPDLDWLQANVGMGLTPLGGGRALASPDSPLDGWTMLDQETRTWRGFRHQAGSALSGFYQSDSGGRVHQLDFDPSGPGAEPIPYRMSSDGGATWSSLELPLPAGFHAEDVDFRAVSALGLAVVGVHATNDTVDQDFVFKVQITGETPRLVRRYAVGLGDEAVGASVASSGARFDFASVALLPDGRAVTSFYDSTTEGIPGLAIEEATDLPAPPDQPPGVPVEPSPGPAPSGSTPADGSPGAQPAPPAPSRFTVTLRTRRRGAWVTAAGSVGVERSGISVRIQRRSGRRWLTAVRTQTRPDGGYSVRLRVRRGKRLRAVVAGTAERPGAVSRARRV